MDSTCNYVGSITLNAMITMLPDKTSHLGLWRDPPTL